MSSAVHKDADAVFAELDVVASLFWRLQESPLWASEGPRLPVSLHEITGALAQTAFTQFPTDGRRWRAGSMMLGISGAFTDRVSDEASTTWSSMVAAAESEILTSPDASEGAVAAAFRSASSRALKSIESEDPVVRDAALRSYDDLVARLRTPEPAIDGLPRLIAALERLDMRPELFSRLNALVASEDDRVRAFAAGRLLVLRSREVPLDLAFDDINGVPIDLCEMRGEVVLVQFWASWCGPCRAEIPHIRSVNDRYGGRGFRVVGVSLDKLADGETPQEARLRVAAFMRDNGMDWPSHFDGQWWKNACASRFGVRSLPASLLLDRNGRIAVLNSRGDDIAGQVESLLA